MASRGDVKAVRKVLYSRKRLRKMLTEIRSIDILMNTNPDAALPSDDIRVTAGSVEPLELLLRPERRLRRLRHLSAQRGRSSERQP